MRIRLLPLLLLFVALIGCGGSTSGGGSNPIIYDFRPARANIDPGSSTLLVANFVGGKGVIDEIGPVVSGVPMPVQPSATTTYHLTVTGDDGTKALASTMLSVGPRSVNIFPSDVQIQPGGSQTFFVSTTGLSDPSVTWSAEQGAIDAAGNYTAPNTPGKYIVSAASKEDPSLCAKCFVTVSPVQLSSDGSSFNTSILSRITFPISLFGATNTGLIYTVLEPNGGTVSSKGVYTAPGQKGLFHLVVQSAQDPNVAILLTITVNPLLVVYPSSQAVAGGKPFAFHAILMGDPNTAVTWSVASPQAGTVDANGVYTGGPNGVLSYVQATSVADPTLIGYAQVVDLPVGFTYTGNLAATAGAPTVLRTQHAMARMLDYANRILICGGLAPATPTTSAEIYDPNSDTFTATTGAMGAARSRHTATALATGQVLVTGGRGASGSPLASAELYDPNTDTFVPVAGSMGAAREDHQAFLLPNGKVLIAGGRGASGTPLNSLEVYDPLTNAFAPVSGTMSDARVDFLGGMLTNGQIYLGGGSLDGSDTALSTKAQRVDPLALTLGAAAALPVGLRNTAAVPAPDGRLGIFGGLSAPGSVPIVSASIRFYDPAADSYSSLTATLSSPRNRPLTSILATGQTLVLGGTSDAAGTTPVGTVDIVDAGGFLPINGSPMLANWIDGISGRCVLLRNGEVLITGSSVDGNGLPVGSFRVQ